MTWKQLSPEELELIAQSIRMMGAVHAQTGEITNKSWEVYLKACQPSIARITREKIEEHLNKISENVDGVIKTAEQRFLYAWAVGMWSSANSMIHSSDGTDRTDLRVEEVLASRLKNTISLAEFNLIESVIGHEFTQAKDNLHFTPLCERFKAVYYEVKDLASRGQGLNKLSEDERLLLLQGIRSSIREHRNQGSAELEYLYAWLKTMSTSGLETRLTQTTWVPSSFNVDRQENLPNLFTKNRGERKQFRFYDQGFSDNPLKKFAEKIQNRDRGAATISIIKIKDKLEIKVFYQANGITQKSTINLQDTMPKGGYRAMVTGIVTEKRGLIFEYLSRETIPFYQYRDGSIQYQKTELDGFERDKHFEHIKKEFVDDDNAVYVIASLDADDCVQIKYGNINQDKCELTYPLSHAGFRKMRLAECTEWTPYEPGTTDKETVVCPSCGSPTFAYMIFETYESEQRCCGALKNTKWKKGCGFAFLDSESRELASDALSYLNKKRA